MTKMETKVQTMLNGITAAIPATSSLAIPGAAAMTQKSIVATLNGYLELYQAVDEGKQTLATAQTALKTSAAAIHQYLTTLAEGLRANFGKSSPSLVQFGLKPTGQPKPQSSETKALANAKRQSTRAARGIMGKNQRAQISATPGLSLVILGPDGKPVSSTSSTTGTPAAAAPSIVTTPTGK
jgi:hypothetical protein